MRLRRAKVAARIKVLFGLVNPGDPRNIVLDGGPNFPHGFDAAFAKLLWPHVVLTRGRVLLLNDLVLVVVYLFQIWYFYFCCIVVASHVIS